jgi:hypothetical protein
VLKEEQDEKVFSSRYRRSYWVTIADSSEDVGLKSIGESMKQISVLLLLVVLLAACSQRSIPEDVELNAQGGSWQKLGGALDFTVENDATEPTLLLDRSGNLIAAWSENKDGWRVYLERWTGTTWQSFGAGSPASTYEYFSIVFDNTNNPVVSSYTTNGVAVYRREPVSQTWKKLGATFDGSVRIAADTNGAVYSVRHANLKFEQGLPRGRNLIRRWNGSSWQTVYTFQKTVEAKGSVVDIPLDGLTFKSDGKPAVFWTYPDSSFTQTISFWNGTSWDDVFSLSLGLNSGALGLDKKDQRLGFRTFSNGDGTSAVFPFQADNGLTPDVNNPLPTTTFPTLTVDNLNRPIITLGVKGSGTANGDLIIKRWNGSSWVNLGGVVDRIPSRDVGSSFGLNSRVLVDGKGTIYAIWKECVGTIIATGCTNNNIYVSKFVP